MFEKLVFWNSDDGGGGAADDTDPDDDNVDDLDDGNVDDPETQFEQALEELDPKVSTAIKAATSNLRSALQKERTAARRGAKAAKKLEAYEKAEEEARKAALSREQQLQEEATNAVKRAEAAETALTTMRLELAVTGEATKQGFAYPDVAIKLIDASQLTIGEDGKVQNAEELVKALLVDKPDLKKKPGQGDNLGNNTRNESKKKKKEPDSSASARVHSTSRL